MATSYSQKDRSNDPSSRKQNLWGKIEAIGIVQLEETEVGWVFSRGAQTAAAEVGGSLFSIKTRGKQFVFELDLG